jgi:hypothetical protein
MIDAAQAALAVLSIDVDRMRGTISPLLTGVHHRDHDGVVGSWGCVADEPPQDELRNASRGSSSA